MNGNSNVHLQKLEKTLVEKMNEECVCGGVRDHK